MYATSAEDKLKVAVGRFIVPIYRRWTRGNLALPWLVGMMALFFLAVAIYLIVRMYGIKSRWTIALIAGIMVTNVTVFAQTATYEHELDVNMLALLFAVAAAYIWNKGHPIVVLIFGGGLATLSMGIYQSYISVTVFLVVFSSILSLLQGKGWKKTLIKGILGMMMLVVGLMVYTYVSERMCEVYQIPLERRVHLLGEMDAARVKELIRGTYQWFFDTLYHMACFPNKLLTRVNFFVVVSSVITMLYWIIQDRTIKVLDVCLMLVLIALIPMATNMIYFLARGEVHDLMHYATWMIYAVYGVLIGLFVLREGVPQWVKTLLKTVCVVTVGILIWQNIAIANIAYLKKDLESKAELSKMTRVVADMEEQEGYVAGETPVAFMGVSWIGGSIQGFDQVGQITGHGFLMPISTDLTSWYFDAYRAYFEYILNYPIVMVEGRSWLWENETYRAMPTYPKEGYVQMIDGVLVVKMGQ